MTASTYERSTARQRVMPNWRKNRPMIPLTKTTGMKMATTARVAARAAKAISCVPPRAAWTRPLPAFAVAEDVLHDHDGVVDDDADGQGHGQEGEGVEGEAEEIDDGHRPQEGHGDGQDDVEGAGKRAEEQPADEGGQEDREEELELDLLDRILDELGRVEDDGRRDALRAGSSGNRPGPPGPAGPRPRRSSRAAF